MKPCSTLIVIAGLDPAIQPPRVTLDARIKSGHDGRNGDIVSGEIDR